MIAISHRNVLETIRAQMVLATPFRALTSDAVWSDRMANENIPELRPVVTLAEARAAGLNRYFNGKPCMHGHVAERYASNGSCLTCHLDRVRRWQARNPDAVRAMGVAYKRENAEKIKLQRQEKYRENPDASREKSRLWREANPEKRAAYERLHYAETREYQIERNKRYNAENREKRRKLNADYHKKNAAKIAERRARYSRTPERMAASAEASRQRRATSMGNLNNRMTCAIWRSLRDGKGGRSWEDLVGYTISHLHAHLERQFVKGMSWANMEKWHVDHITPLSSFSFESHEDLEFKAAWTLTNLRPLWKEQNLSKGARREFLL